MSDGMGGHQSHAMGKDEWLTPPFVLAALGAFDLDPCSPIQRPWDTAAQHYTVLDDGLSKPWHGRVWCNPPYGVQAGTWLARLAAHGNGIALVFARTETAAWVEHVWAKASGIRFIAGRLHFHHVNGSRAPANSGAPSALVAYGQENAERLRTCSIAGTFVSLTRGVQAGVRALTDEAIDRLARKHGATLDDDNGMVPAFYSIPMNNLAPFVRAAIASGVMASGDGSAWWALVMCAAASIEDAANCLRDPDAKKQAEGAAKHYREAAQKLMAASGVPASDEGRQG